MPSWSPRIAVIYCGPEISLLFLLTIAAYAADAPEAVVATSGVDYGRGNLVGIQPWLTEADYASEEAFRTKLAASFEIAKAQGWLYPETVVVLPEHVGTWLFAVGEGELVAQTAEEAIRAIGRNHYGRFLVRRLGTSAKERARDAVLRIKAPEMAVAYDTAFSGLARTYGVTVVAGSILLPSPEIQDGHVVAGRGRLQNVGAVYAPDGRAHAELARQVVIPEADQGLVRGASLEALKVYETPIGRLGVLICADGWDPDAYDVIAGQDADVIAAPGSIEGSEAWKAPWHGYGAIPLPQDVDPTHVDGITIGEAWNTYAAPGRAGGAGAEAAMSVFLRGRIWDWQGDGQPIGALGHTPMAGPSGEGPAVFNLWLGAPPIAAEAEDAAEAALAPSHPGL